MTPTGRSLLALPASHPDQGATAATRCRPPPELRRRPERTNCPDCALAQDGGGDSDSTGAIAGNILGAALGRGAIPAAWIEELEGAELVERVAADLDSAYSPGVDRHDEERLQGDYPAASR